MFELDGEYKTKLDFAKLTSPNVAELIAMEVLLLDEFSMLDLRCFEGIQEILGIIDHSRRPGVTTSDPFGSVHMILFGGERFVCYPFVVIIRRKSMTIFQTTPTCQ